MQTPCHLKKALILLMGTNLKKNTRLSERLSTANLSYLWQLLARCATMAGTKMSNGDAGSVSRKEIDRS